MAFVGASGRGSHFDFLATLHVATKKLYSGRWVEKSFMCDEGESRVMCGIRLLQIFRNLDQWETCMRSITFSPPVRRVRVP